MPVVLAGSEISDPVLAKTPQRKDASWFDSWVVIKVPSCCVPESVIDGVRSDNAVVLCMAVSKYSKQHKIDHLPVPQFCQRTRFYSAHEIHAFKSPWRSASRPSYIDIRCLIPLGREPW